MRIRRKTLIIIAVSSICTVFLMTIAARALLVENLLCEENRLLEQKFNVLITLLNKEKFSVQSTTMDWSKWDDTYEFVKDRNQRYIDVNLQNYTFESLKLNMMIYTDNKGQIIYSKGYDFETDRETPIDLGLLNQIKEGKLNISPNSPNNSCSGIIIVSGKPMIIASSTVTSSDRKLPVDGSLIIGRYINESYIQYLEGVLQQNIKIKGLSNVEQEALVKNKIQNQNQDISDMAIKKDSNTLIGYGVIKDINGTPDIVVTSSMVRDVYNKGLNNLKLFIFIFLIGLLLITIIGVIVLDKIVVRRLKKLHDFFDSTGKNQDIGARIELTGKDEISGLAESTNKMLQELERAYKDINNRKKLEDALRESVINCRKIVDLSPEAMTITVNGIVVLANKQALKYYANPIGKRIETFTTPDFVDIMRKRFKIIIDNKIEKTTFDYKLVLEDKRLIDMEISSSYFSYKGKPAVISLFRDISQMKRELNSAANFQKQVFKKVFPVPGKARMEALYVPSKTVSGDFYFFHKVSENLVIGILGDVSGKGITAALSISAFNVLFGEAVLVSHDPAAIVNILNEKVANFLGERYIAACCFSFDFNKNEAKIVGAGISQFIFVGQTDKCIMREVKGPFLGMFEHSNFDEEVIQFYPGNKFYFYTDGLDFVFPEEGPDENLIKTATSNEFINYLNSVLEDMVVGAEGIKDDCTVLSLDIV